jgi:hypothetical protein
LLPRKHPIGHARIHQIEQDHGDPINRLSARR